ncbi:MAG: SdpI family protein [Patescibacteria group bacterium]|nr:SdpI family protein [Patescibacteria group bacterium]
MKIIKIAILFIIFFFFALAIYFFIFCPQLPERMASHWNVAGEVDGHISKFWGLFLMPLTALGCFLLFIFIPKIDPLKKNIEKFRKFFDIFIFLFLIYFLYVYLLTIAWNFGFRFKMARLMAPAIGFLFLYCGILIKKTKRNWFIGIRTPWTLSSDNVWDKTHKIGGKLFKIMGMISFLGVIFPDYFLWLLLVPMGIVVLFILFYSYLEYQKEMKE